MKRPERSHAADGVRLSASSLPDDLRAIAGEPRWVAFGLRWLQRNGEEPKLPYQPSGRHARINDAATFARLDEVLAFCRLRGEGHFPALAMSAEDDLDGIDLDGSVVGGVVNDRKAGTLQPWAQRILSELHTYSERSESFSGRHAIARAEGGSAPEQPGGEAYRGGSSS